MATFPVEVVFRNMENSPLMESEIRENIDRMTQFHPKIMGCRVLMQMPHKKHQKGNLYHVKIELDVPQKRLVVGRDTTQNHAHEDPYVAIRDAFKSLERRLKAEKRNTREAPRRERGRVGLASGKVARIYPQDGYGFIETRDGRDVYFHENSVLEAGFDNLDVGDLVHFAEEQGFEGPMASTVHTH